MKDIKKLKTVHIHTDYKFVQGSQRFFGKFFDNSLVIFIDDVSYNGPYQDSAIYYNENDLDKVIEHCKGADLVVLYNLDVLKSQIAVELPNHVKIIWRFFGNEFYKRMKLEVLSEKSRSTLLQGQKWSFKESVKYILRPLYHKIKYGDKINNLFYRAMCRIDYMLVFSKKEYKYLSQYWEPLPECILLPIITGNFNYKCPKIDLRNKCNEIVLGNSRNIFNNHLDIIEMIESSTEKENYKFLLLFNYGSEGAYADAVRETVCGKKYFQLIEKYIPSNEFKSFYKNVSALIINGYRQMAMGSIFLALKNGVKIYLNRKNVMMDWLLGEGIQVFSVKNLASDLENGNIKLHDEIAYHNLEGLYKLYKNYTEEEFQEKIYNKVISGDN